MLIRFSGCCFELKFSLLSCSEFISYDRDNCFGQRVTIVGSQFIFLIYPKKMPTPLVSLMTNHRRIVLLDIVFIFATIAIWFRFSFHNWKCENTSLIVWTVVIFYWFFPKDTWPLVYHMNAKDSFKLMSFGLLLPWLRIWIYLITKPLSMKIYWLHLIL